MDAEKITVNGVKIYDTQRESNEDLRKIMVDLDEQCAGKSLREKANLAEALLQRKGEILWEKE